MELFAISGLINGLIAISFAFLIISKNLFDRKNQFFFLMNIAFVLWAFSYWQWQLSTEYVDALFWIRALSLGSLLIPVFFYHWILLVLENKSKINKFLLLISYLFAFTVIPFSFSEIFIQDVVPRLFFPYWPVPGVLYHVYLLLIYIGLISYSVFLLLKDYLKVRLVDIHKKGQILYILTGTLLGFGGGATNFFLWYNIPIPPFGNFVAGLFPFLLGYSIIKYRLFNIKTIAAELLIFFILVLLFIEVALSETVAQFSLRSTIFFVVMILSFLLTKSVYREVEQREQIEKLAKELEKANAQQVNLIHFITHQVKGFFTKSRNIFASLLDGDYGTLSASAKILVEEGFKSDTKAVDTVQQILQASNVKKGTVAYTKTDFDLKAMVVEEFEKEKINAEIKKVNFKLTTDPEPFMFNGDKDQFVHVIHNLIDNSIKYTPKGTVAVTLTKQTGKIIFKVKDTGVGITSEDMKNLFKEGGRGKESVKVNTDSTGYGLFIVKGIVEAHGGTVKALSEGLNKGSEFVVELPVK